MKTFLSQTEIPLAWALKHGLGDPYRLHQWIWNALPNDPDARRDFLFRADKKKGFLRILLLSARVPVLCVNGEWKTTEVSDTFLGHGAYRFQLRVNPVFRRQSDHRRIALLDEIKIREWISRKLSDAGCQICDLETTAPRKISFRKTENTQPGTLSSVDASGTLAVRDETAFRSAFDSGIGPAKGFGFGLLLLQPIQV